MAWTEELKAEAIKAYQDAEPTPETSTEIITEIAKDMEQSPNGVRMVLVQAGVYVKKTAAPAATTAAKPGAAKAAGEGSKRVSKEDSIAALKAAIEAKGAELDEEILSKLTGKAAIYFTKVIGG